MDWGELDYLVIDCPPGTSDEHLSIATFLSALKNTAAIVVTTPHELSILDVRKEIGFCAKTNIRVIGVVENMSGFLCPNCNCNAVLFPNTSGGVPKMCEEMEVTLISSIPMSIALSTAADQGRALLETDLVVFGLYEQLANSVKSYFSN